MEQNTTNNNKPQKDIKELLETDFPQCFDKNGDFDFEKFKQELKSNKVDFSKESYSLEWLGKSYARLLANDATTTLLKEDSEWNKKDQNKNSQNLLIKGDNLEVLKHLYHAYYNKIKMIYIDPPYNTGSDDFVYEDDRKFTVEEFSKLAGVEEEKAKRILNFVDSKSNSHSAWLTFMYPRLYIARQLLKDDGVIFISIDDNEVAQLRMLMDEIFGEQNFIKDLIVNTSEGGGQAKHVINGHEYLLVYAKNINDFDNLKRPKDIRGKKIKIDGELYWIQEDSIRKEFGKYGNLHYEEILEYKNEEFKKKIDEGLKRNEYILVPKNYGMNIIGKLRKVSEDYSKFHSILNIEKISKHLTKEGISEIEDIFSVSKGKSPFSNPKPLELLKKIVLSASFNTKNDIILDFFAGSGTTGDAVMQLNSEDNGERKYILVQLPEKIDPKKSKTAYNFVKKELGKEEPTIFEITKERLIRSAEKIKNENINNSILEKQKEIKEIQEKLDFVDKEKKIEELQKGIDKLKKQDLGFKIFETTPIWENYVSEIENFDPKIKLFDENSLTEQDLQKLLLTWKTYDGLKLTQELEKIDFGGYIGYYKEKRLYLMNKGFNIDHLKNLLEKIDNDRDFNPESVIVFGYYFESKTLREIAENVSSYANKKNTPIDFITRY
jgi:adenine-specific DNA-methyltransferase